MPDCDYLLYDELYERFVDDGKQLFRHSLCCGQHPRAKPPRRDYGLSHLVHVYTPRMFLMVSFSSRVSADFTTYASETQLEKSCLNSP